MGKPAAIRVPSDDCVVWVGAAPVKDEADAREEYHPHEGEWVEIGARLTVADYRDDDELARLRVEWRAHTDDPERASIKAIADRYYELAGAILSRRLRAWSWTDDLGEPLPQPHGNAEAVFALRPEEIGYLLVVSRQESRGQRGNA